jgi:hypothetical protein
MKEKKNSGRDRISEFQKILKSQNGPQRSTQRKSQIEHEKALTTKKESTYNRKEINF